MSTGDYIATFASILVGLAVADLVTSFNRLMRARARVAWDWLPVAVALLVLLSSVQFWWSRFPLWTAAQTFSFAAFLPDLLLLLLIFFLAAASLPDEMPAEGRFDLGAYYRDNARYFWGLFAAFVATAMIVRASRAAAAGAGAGEILLGNWVNLLSVALMILLAFTARRWLHAAVVLLISALVISLWVRMTIGG